MENNDGFINKYFFNPNTYHKILSFLLLPLSYIYALIAIVRKKYGKKHDYGIKIISIGNIVSGGSGKTPFCIALAKILHSRGNEICIILRGYKRESKGLLEISNKGEILGDVKSSGDEAMLIALLTKAIKASVIVSENRHKAICHAKDKGFKLLLLDDAFRFSFKKFDILLEPIALPYYNRVLPSGYYRFPLCYYKKCDLHLKEGVDYKRIVKVNIESKRYILASAIANPTRLEAFLSDEIKSKIVHRFYLPDHASFIESSLKNLLEKYNANCILMTSKDYVKCNNFNLDINVIELDIDISSEAIERIMDYVN